MRLTKSTINLTQKRDSWLKTTSRFGAFLKAHFAYKSFKKASEMSFNFDVFLQIDR